MSDVSTPVIAGPETGELAVEDAQRTSNIVAGIWLATTGAVSFLFLPLIIASMASSLGFSNTELGYMAAADMLGMGLMSASSIFWVRKVNWRKTALMGIVAIALANLLSTLASDSLMLGGLRLLSGCGGGCIIAIGVACQSDQSRADRIFSYFIALEMLVMSIGFFLLPYADEAWGLNGILYIIAIVSTGALVILHRLPERGIERKHQMTEGQTNNYRVTFFIALIAALLFNMSQGGLWAFLARIGSASNLSASEVGSVLAIAAYAGIVGALCAGYFVQKIGRVGGFFVVLIGEIIFMSLLYGVIGYWRFMVAIVIFQFCWSVGWPLFMGAFNSIDSSGRLVLLFFAIAKLGYTLGPIAVGYLVSDGNYLTVLMFSAIICTLGIALVIYLLRKVR